MQEWKGKHYKPRVTIQESQSKTGKAKVKRQMFVHMTTQEWHTYTKSNANLSILRIVPLRNVLNSYSCKHAHGLHLMIWYDNIMF